MSDNVLQLKGRIPDTEKITINLGYVDLGRIDLLVQEGFFSNRTDFIRTAIRNQLRSQSEEVSRSIERHTLDLGLLELGVVELEAARAAGETLHIKVVGLVRIALGRDPRTRAADDRLPDGARRTAGEPTGQGRPGHKDQIGRERGRKGTTTMKSDYVAEILRATGSLQSGDPAGVTAIIQNALAAVGLTASVGNGASGNAVPDIQVPQALLPGLGHAHFARTKRLRKPLSEVVHTLRATRKQLGLEGSMSRLGRPVRTPDLQLPDGAQFLDSHYSCAAGTRRYRLYVPSTANEGLEGLIVMLHGCTQNPEDFAAGTGMNSLAEKHRLLIVYPAQTGDDNSMSCWNWFRPEDQMRGAGEPAIIAGLTESLRDQYGIAPNRVFVAGLSAGGAMAAIMGETYPELYEAVGVHSGLAYGSANDVMSAFTAMRGQVGVEQALSSPEAGRETAPRMIVFHGSADTTVHPSNAERIVANQGGIRGKISRHEHAAGGTRGYTRLVVERGDAAHGMECWMIEGAQHAWAGGHPSGSYTDPRGPSASAAMVRFFVNGASDAL